MTEQNQKQLIDNFAEMEQLLKKYTDATNIIMQTESDEIEKIAEKIEEREVLIGEIDFLKKQCTSVINACEKQEAELIRDMLTGTNLNQRISDELIPVRNSIVGLRSAQCEAAERDKALQAQFSSRTIEAKDQLMKLNDDKKKLDYYSSVNSAPANLGGSLDSSF